MLLLLFLSHPVVSNSLRPRGLQHARSPCPSPLPEACPSLCSLHRRCHPAISPSDALFSFCPPSFPASGTFPMSWLFSSGDQNTGDSVSTSVLPTSIQGWFPFCSVLWSRSVVSDSLQPHGLSHWTTREVPHSVCFFVFWYNFHFVNAFKNKQAMFLDIFPFLPLLTHYAKSQKFEAISSKFHW